MKILITLMGPSSWGLFNSLWGMIRSHNFVPDKVYILGREDDRGDFQDVSRMITPLLREYGSNAEIIFETVEGDSADDAYQRVSKILENEKGKKNELALDVTPGRKAAVLGSMLAGWAGGDMRTFLFDHVFYLYIESLRNASRPYILIPISIQHSHDVVKEHRGEKGGT